MREKRHNKYELMHDYFHFVQHQMATFRPKTGGYISKGISNLNVSCPQTSNDNKLQCKLDKIGSERIPE